MAWFNAGLSSSGGGGGGSADRNYSEITLWSGSETPPMSGTDITLTDDIANYDEIVFCVISESGRKSQESFFVSGLSIGETYIEETYPPENIGVFWVYTSGTSIKIYRIASASGSAITYAKVVGIKYGNGTKTFHNYSTAEQVVGTWIDGSTVYEKTVAFTTPNSSSYTRQSLGLAIASISKIWIFDGFAMKNSEFVTIGPYNSYPDSHEFVGLIQNDGTNMTFDYRVGTAIYQAPAYVVIRYIKTT